MDRVRGKIGCDGWIARRYSGYGVGIAVLDTGVCGIHPDLRNTVIDFVDFVNGNNYLYDDNGHGTHISGIIAGSAVCSRGKYRGIASGANLICLKVLDQKGDGNTNEVLRALDYVISNKEELGIRIVNISIGTIPKSNRLEHTRLIQGVENAWDAGLCVVVAAGNNGPQPMSITSPGISRKVITVGSCDNYISNDEKLNIREGFSGRGPTPFCIVKPEVLAPGVGIKSCLYRSNDYVSKSGSSMSTAVVSASIALLLEKYPDMTNTDVKLRLYENCIDLGLPKNQQGWGMLHLHRLLL